jgi:hypothetical protein
LAKHIQLMTAGNQSNLTPGSECNPAVYQRERHGRAQLHLHAQLLLLIQVVRRALRSSHRVVNVVVLVLFCCFGFFASPPSSKTVVAVVVAVAAAAFATSSLPAPIQSTETTGCGGGDGGDDVRNREVDECSPKSDC